MSWKMIHRVPVRKYGPNFLVSVLSRKKPELCSFCSFLRSWAWSGSLLSNATLDASAFSCLPEKCTHLGLRHWCERRPYGQLRCLSHHSHEAMKLTDWRICQQRWKPLFSDIMNGFHYRSSKHWLMLTSSENDTGLLSWHYGTGCPQKTHHGPIFGLFSGNETYQMLLYRHHREVVLCLGH